MAPHVFAVDLNGAKFPVRGIDSVRSNRAEVRPAVWTTMTIALRTWPIDSAVVKVTSCGSPAIEGEEVPVSFWDASQRWLWWL